MEYFIFTAKLVHQFQISCNEKIDLEPISHPMLLAPRQTNLIFTERWLLIKAINPVLNQRHDELIRRVSTQTVNVGDMTVEASSSLILFSWFFLCMSDPWDVYYNNLYIANVKFASVIIKMASWRMCIIFESRIPISCQSITSLKGRFYNNFFIVDFFRFRAQLFIRKRINNGELLLSKN